MVLRNVTEFVLRVTSAVGGVLVCHRGWHVLLRNVPVFLDGEWKPVALTDPGRRWIVS